MQAVDTNRPIVLFVTTRGERRVQNYRRVSVEIPLADLAIRIIGRASATTLLRYHSISKSVS